MNGIPGTGMVAATAAGLYGSLHEACGGMAQNGVERRPDPAAMERFDRDCRVFLAMHVRQRAREAIR